MSTKQHELEKNNKRNFVIFRENCPAADYLFVYFIFLDETLKPKSIEKLISCNVNENPLGHLLS